METKPKNRAWVKDAAIVFLVVLLLLTFFSNTIMNHSLPEVATNMVSNGTITAKVRGTGTVTANGNHKVKAKSNMTIGRVVVKAGQEVNAGDVLFVLGAADSTELEEAMIALEDLQVQYNQAALSVPVLDQFVDEQNELKKKRDAVADYKRTLDELAMSLNNVAIGSNIGDTYIAAQRILDLYSRRSEVISQINSYKNDLYTVEELAQLDSQLDETLSKISTEMAKPETERSQDLLNILNEEKARLESEILAKQSALRYTDKPTIEGQISSLDGERLQIENELMTLNVTDIDGDYKLRAAKAYLEAYKNYEYSVDAVNAALANLNYMAETQNRSVASAGAGLGAISNKIKRQQEKIKKLSGEGDENTITANVSGTVTEVNCTAGDSVVKDDILASIEVPNQGYTVSFSVTNDQAKRLHVGDTATISNYYWGNKIVATLATIQTDKKNPMTNKTLTFDLEGDVTSGSEITVSVGQKSANYDTIIPNSAIRTDSNGSFVLAVTAKNSPLGNRYIAKRVAIEVLAADDTNSAVTADLNNGDYVITTSSAPVASGDMVRLADAEN